MPNKNFSQFDTATVTDNVNNKFVVGYDSTTNPNKEIKIALNKFITADANGQVNITDPDGLKVVKLTTSAGAAITGHTSITNGLLTVTPAGMAARVKPATWGGGVTSWDFYSDGGSFGAGPGGALNAWFNATGAAYFKGQVSTDAQLRANAGVRAASGDGNQLRLPHGESGIIFRNDGANFYILQTNRKDPEGSWSADRNFAINLDGAKDTWMTSPLNVYAGIGANYLTIRRQNDQTEGGEIAFCRATDNTAFWFNDVLGNATPAMRWHNRGVVRLNLDSEGNLSASGDVTAFSDAKLKTNVKTIEGALASVKSLRGVSFDRIDTNSKSIGLIAQEVEAVIPEVVKDIEGTKSVAYGNLVGLLIEAVKELSQEVESLKAKVK